MRNRLDAGLGQQLIDKHRAMENNEMVHLGGKYIFCILIALMMHVGANIKPEDIQHVRELVSHVPSRVGYHLPIFDDGFREPGKKQFLAALDNYKPGTPRDFRCPSCFNCGKISADINRNLKKCAGCTELEEAWFCDKVSLPFLPPF